SATYQIIFNGAVIDTVTVNQQVSPGEDDGMGNFWKTLGGYTLGNNGAGQLQVRLAQSANGQVVAGPVRLTAPAGVTTTVPATITPGGAFSTQGNWLGLQYATGNGNFPMWESCLLRDKVFRVLFKDWQNGAQNFPDLGDLTSHDPNEDAPL